MRNGGGYEHGYAACPCFWGQGPGREVRAWAQRHPARSRAAAVLDAGAGEGKNAAYLASLGCQVLAVEISEQAIDNGRRTVQADPRLTWRLTDVRSVMLTDGTFDVVVAYGLYHCLDDYHDISELVSRLQRATRPGGWHIVATFNDRRPQNADAHPAFSPCLLAHDEYVSFYRGWHFESVSDEDLVESHPDKHVVHTHAVTRLVARKVDAA